MESNGFLAGYEHGYLPESSYQLPGRPHMALPLRRFPTKKTTNSHPSSFYSLHAFPLSVFIYMMWRYECSHLKKTVLPFHPPTLAAVSTAGCYAIYTIFNVLGLYFCITYVPETMGLSLEEPSSQRNYLLNNLFLA